MYPQSELFLEIDRVLRDLIWGPFLNGFCLNLLLPVILIFLVLILFNRIGSSYGVAQLFWLPNRSFLQQAFVGFALVTVLWQVILAGFITDPFSTNYTVDRDDFVDMEWTASGWSFSEKASIGAILTYGVVVLCCLSLSAMVVLTVLRLSQVVHQRSPLVGRVLVVAALLLGSLALMAMFSLPNVALIGLIAASLVVVGNLRSLTAQMTSRRGLAWLKLIVGLIAFVLLAYLLIRFRAEDWPSGRVVPAIYPLVGALLMFFIVELARDPDPAERRMFNRSLLAGLAIGGILIIGVSTVALAIERRVLDDAAEGVAPPIMKINDKNDEDNACKKEDKNQDPTIRVGPLTQVGRQLVDFGGWGEAEGRAVTNRAREWIHTIRHSASEDRPSVLIPNGFSEQNRTDIIDQLEKGKSTREILKVICYEPGGKHPRQAQYEYVKQRFAIYFPVYGLYFVGAGLAILLFGITVAFTNRLSSPAVGIVLLVHVLLAFYVLIYNFLSAPMLWQLLPFLLLVLAGIPTYKHWYPKLEKYYFGTAGAKKLRDYYEQVGREEAHRETPIAEQPADVPADPSEVLPRPDPHRTHPVPHTLPAGERRTPGRVTFRPPPTIRDGKPVPGRPMAIVCVSGGGSRSAAWTMTVLSELEKAFHAEGIAFPYHIRLISGASGGMIGAAYYVAALEKYSESEPARVQRDPTVLTHPGNSPIDMLTELEHLNRNIRTGWLNPVVRRLATWDLMAAFMPVRFFTQDRGKILEQAWSEKFHGALDRTFEHLRPGEEDGWRPSLVFSPMLVEDGRVLLISNLDLDELVQNRGNHVGQDRSRILSREAVEFFRLFEGEQNQFPLSTAVRMSAAFPYVMPAVDLPTRPIRRVVDAGYYDNYGVGVGASWLFNFKEWVKANSSGVVLIQIRDGVSNASRRMEPESLKIEEPASVPERGLQFLTSPFDALLSARVGTTTFRNDHLLTMLSYIFGQDDANDSQRYFTTAAFEFSADRDVSMSFTLTDDEKELVENDANRPEFRDQIRDLLSWWKEREQCPLSGDP